MLSNETISDMLMTYPIPIISLFGIITNSISIIVFLKIIQQNNNSVYTFLNKCILSKSINDCIQLIFQIFSPILFCKKCGLSNQILPQIWFIYFFHFGESVVIFNSSLFEMAAVFEQLCLFKNSFNFLKKIKNFNILFILITFCGILFNIIIFFRFEINTQTNFYNNSTIYSYNVDKSLYYHSTFDRYIRFTETLLEDILTFIILLILSLLILVELNWASIKKNKVHQVSTQKRNIFDRAHKKFTNLIIMSCLVYLLGQMPLIVYYIPFDKNDQQFWYEYYYWSLVTFYFSYLVNFFIYYFFNRNFEYCFKLLLSLL